MRALDYLKMPLFAAGIATGAKSFRDNPVLGSSRLNERGLHVKRIKFAERMSDWRRGKLAGLVNAGAAQHYERHGYIRHDDVLSASELTALRQEVERGTFHAWDMRQGNAVTRFIPLPPEVLRETPALKAFIEGPLFRGGLQYVASTKTDPIVFLHIVLTDPADGQPDPQTAFHSDTFHATAKAWFFLYDVNDEEGPFTYVAGSHRLTPARLEWERMQSLTAAKDENTLHARGSFRVTADGVRQMGFADPVRFAVPGNTLVIADTHGFHARAKSTRASVRVGIYGSLRRNPYLPFTGLDPFLWPGLRHRQGQIHMKEKEWTARIFGKASSHRYAGKISPTAPPTI